MIASHNNHIECVMILLDTERDIRNTDGHTTL